MNKKKKLLSHLKQKDSKRLRWNWNCFHRLRKCIDPAIFERICGGSCLNCRHCVLDDKVDIWCSKKEYSKKKWANPCHDYEPADK